MDSRLRERALAALGQLVASERSGAVGHRLECTARCLLACIHGVGPRARVAGFRLPFDVLLGCWAHGWAGLLHSSFRETLRWANQRADWGDDRDARVRHHAPGDIAMAPVTTATRVPNSELKNKSRRPAMTHE